MTIDERQLFNMLKELTQMLDKNARHLESLDRNMSKISQEVHEFKSMFSSSGAWGASSLLDRIRKIETQVEVSATQLKEINRKTK